MILVFAGARWLHEASLMLLFGGAMLRMLLQTRLPSLVLPKGRERPGLALLALASALVWFALATARMAGHSAAAADPATLWLAARATLFGRIFLARAVLLVFLCVAVAARWRHSIAALLSGAALALISVTGHAAEASPAHFMAIGAASDSLHLLTAGFWIGSLVLLIQLFALRTERVLLAASIASFAEWGMIAVALLVLTGMLDAAMILLGGDGHDAPLYLGVLGAKLVLVLAMVALAMVNHFRLLPQLCVTGPAEALHANVGRELALGLAVVALAALLGALSPMV